MGRILNVRILEVHMSGTGRSYFLVAWVVAFLVCTYAAVAEDARPVRLFAGGGFAIPAGALNDGSALGYAGTAGIAFRPALGSSPEINVILRTTYYKFPSSTDESGDVSFAAGGVELQLDRALNGAPNIFLVGGGGVARTEVDPHTYISFATGVNGVQVTRPGYRENNPYMTAGIGLQTSMLVLEARLTNAFGTRTKNLTWFTLMLEITTK